MANTDTMQGNTIPLFKQSIPVNVEVARVSDITTYPFFKVGVIYFDVASKNIYVASKDTTEYTDLEKYTNNNGMPMLKIENDQWYASYDNGETWISLNESAKGSAGTKLMIDPETYHWMLSDDEGKTWKDSGVVAKGKDGVNGRPGTDIQIREVDGVNYWFINQEKTAMQVSGKDGASTQSIYIRTCARNRIPSIPETTAYTIRKTFEIGAYSYAVDFVFDGDYGKAGNIYAYIVPAGCDLDDDLATDYVSKFSVKYTVKKSDGNTRGPISSNAILGLNDSGDYKKVFDSFDLGGTITFTFKAVETEQGSPVSELKTPSVTWKPSVVNKQIPFDPADTSLRKDRWHAAARGVCEKWPTEWIAYRETKRNEETGEILSNEWTEWSVPAIWATYGNSSVSDADNYTEVKENIDNYKAGEVIYIENGQAGTDDETARPAGLYVIVQKDETTKVLEKIITAENENEILWNKFESRDDTD